MKKNVNVFTFLFVFFVVVALGSLFVLNSSGSVFDRDRDTLGAEVAVMDKSVVGIENPNPEPEITTAIAEESSDETELSNKEKLEQMLVEIDAESGEKISDDETTVNDIASEPEPEPEPEPEGGIIYYTFRLQTDGANINLRKGPTTDSTILYILEPSTVGYVLQPGNEWAKVYTENGWEGYLATEFLIIDRVKPEDFPEEIRDRVEEPAETLTSAFEGNG